MYAVVAVEVEVKKYIRVLCIGCNGTHSLIRADVSVQIKTVIDVEKYFMLWWSADREMLPLIIQTITMFDHTVWIYSMTVSPLRFEDVWDNNMKYLSLSVVSMLFHQPYWYDLVNLMMQ